MDQKLRQDIYLGNNIRRLRCNLGLTQEQVVARMQLLGIDITRSIYSQIECGTYNIKISELAALTEIFRTDYNGIFEGIQFSVRDNDTP